MFAYQTLKYIPAKVLFLEGEFFGVLMFSLGGLLFALVPFWEKRIPEKNRNAVFGPAAGEGQDAATQGDLRGALRRQFQVDDWPTRIPALADYCSAAPVGVAMDHRPFEAHVQPPQE